MASRTAALSRTVARATGALTSSRSADDVPAAGGWYPVARSAEIGTTPVTVGASGRAYVVVRLRPGAEVTAFSARCPHRLVPLTAASVVDGRLQCSYHGWQFDAEGRCVEIPSLGDDGSPPPRADLAAPWAVEERHGWVWLAPERTPVQVPPRPGQEPVPEPVPALPAPEGPVFGNLDPSLTSAWHPVALTDELLVGGWLSVQLLGSTWTLHRTAEGLSVEPAAWGAEDEKEVPAYEVLPGPGGFTSVQEQWFDNPADPGVLDGSRPLRQRRRATYVVRLPFQLLLRLEELGTGAVKTILFLLQPEDADSTRVYTCMLLSGIGGARTIPPDVVASEVAFEEAVLAEDLALQQQMASTGLPLMLRDELHVRADRLGVALRRGLADFAAGR
jgi:phenylpropionate dioxygenase-like ring-hydroxylating dioxygenase large terminal subunit